MLIRLDGSISHSLESTPKSSELCYAAFEPQGDSEMMHLIWTILIGFVAGLIARAVTPGKGPSGFFLTSVLGIAGSIAATYIGQALGLYSEGHMAGFVASIIGAVILLAAYHFFTRNSER
jgi:uncharacterized membrane protein YeaQ/YmgE (transglycosylase-associated protein family)